MAYASLMVHLDLDRPNENRLKVAAQIVARHGAKLIGVTAAVEPTPPLDGNGFATATAFEETRAQIAARIDETRDLFYAVLAGQGHQLEWISDYQKPNLFLERQCRAADLIIVAAHEKHQSFDPTRHVDPSQLVLAAGRPLLVVPTQLETPKVQRSMIAWKDTRECRRALADALPLLRTSDHVLVVEVPEQEESWYPAQKNVGDVVLWLKAHGIAAEGMAPDPIPPLPMQIDALAKKSHSDLIVAGAYGHSRLREWIFGGVTRHLLSENSRCVFLAH